MSKKRKNKENHDAGVLPSREVMSLISPGATAVPGLGGLLGADPTAGAPAPGSGVPDLAGGAAQHAADGHPAVSDQPTDTSTSSSQTASSQT
jgi:hypothetical protein